MAAYDAQLRMEDTDDAPINVMIDLTDDARIVVSAGDVELGDWSRDQVRLTARPDGFHLMAEGEGMLLEVAEDARFALDLGMRNAPPILRRRMSALLREDEQADA